MNKTDRKQISEWIDKLDEIKSDIESMQEYEEEKYDNLPDGIQDSETGERIQNGIECLEDAVSSLDEAIDYLNDAME